MRSFRFRGSRSPLLAVFGTLATLAWLATASAEFPIPRGDDLAADRMESRENEASVERSDAPLAREGTHLEAVRGNFRHVGERLVFQPQNEARPLTILENLNAERVTKTLLEAGKSGLPWSVSGTVTEFRGDNYLLLSRAILKSPQNQGSNRAAR